jgi:hypothetical protein
MKMRAAIVGLSILLGTSSQQVFAWGNDGHMAVALIAQQCPYLPFCITQSDGGLFGPATNDQVWPPSSRPNKITIL